MIIATQIELDAALAANPNAEVEMNEGRYEVTISVGSPWFTVRGSAELVVTAYGSSAPVVTAYDSNSPRVIAYGSSAPEVRAYGSSAPVVTAYDSNSPRVIAYGSSAPEVRAYGSSAPVVYAHSSSAPVVTAYGSSAPRVIACDSSAPVVIAYGSSAPEVTAYGSSAPVVTARDSSAPRVFGKAQVVSRDSACPRLWGDKSQCDGDHKRFHATTPAEWCEFWGIKVKKGIAVLYKALNEDFTSPHGTSYAPGTTPEAPDWDGGKQECGGGLHFSPTPQMARRFHDKAVKYAACPVALADIAIHPDGEYPQKCKAQRVCAPCWEVDAKGERA